MILSLQAFVAVNAQTTGSGLGRLHTDGKWIKDQAGNIVILRGASVFWRWYYSDPWKQYNPFNYPDESPAKYDLYKQIGANFLRVQLNKWLWDNAPEYRKAVDLLVRYCKDRGIMVVLGFLGWVDMEPGHYQTWTKQDQVNYILNGTMTAFMQTLAQRYQTETSVIGFEIMPEKPSDTSWATYRHITQSQARAEYAKGLITAIRAIHSVSPDFLVFVYPSSNDHLIQFITENPLREPNVVLSMMRSVSWDKGWFKYADAYYAGDAAHGAALMEQTYQLLLFSAQTIAGVPNHPVMLMETEVASGLPNTPQYVRDLFSIFEKHQVGIAFWTFDEQVSKPDPKTGLVWQYLLRASSFTLTDVGQTWASNIGHSKQLAPSLSGNWTSPT